MHVSVVEVNGLASSARATGAATEGAIRELLVAQAESAALVQSLAGRHAGASREDVEAVVHASQAEVVAALTAATSHTVGEVGGVHDSVRKLASAHEAGLKDSASVAAGLRSDMWKGFDDAASQRRDVASATHGELASLSGELMALSGAVSAAAASSHAAQQAADAVLTSADAPIRRAAEVTLALLPGAVESIYRLGSATESLRAASDASAAALSAQCGELAAAQRAQEVLASLSSLRDGVWKGFDDAATQRREIAGAAASEQHSAAESAAAAAGALDAKSQELLTRSDALKVALLELQVCG